MIERIEKVLSEYYPADYDTSYFPTAQAVVDNLPILDGLDDEDAHFAILNTIDRLAQIAIDAEQAEADEAEYREWEERENRIKSAVEVILDALRIDHLSVNDSMSSHSRYVTYRDISIRVSDHASPDGGGFCHETQERLGDADIGYVISDDIDLDAKTIRTDVARVLWQNK